MPNWRIYKVFLFTKPGWNGLGPLNVLIIQEGWQIAKTASYTVTWVSKYFRALLRVMEQDPVSPWTNHYISNFTILHYKLLVVGLTQ